MSGLLAGRVAIITGAGGGLGAAHARVFAAEGCAVIVNDINTEAAQVVVDEITGAGGKAAVNSSDITNYDDSLNAVKQAIDSFGDLHIVLNNAGVNRDRMFASMTEQEWDTIMAVHLKGHFCISSHAVHYWRGRSKEGKPVELARYNITANAMAPSARTGMTSAVPEMAKRMAKPEDGSFDHFAPENVSNVLAWLASAEAAQVTGKVFEAEGGRICICDGWRTTEGVDRGAAWAPAEIGEAMKELLAKEVPAQKVWGT